MFICKINQSLIALFLWNHQTILFSSSALNGCQHCSLLAFSALDIWIIIFKPYFLRFKFPPNHLLCISVCFGSDTHKRTVFFGTVAELNLFTQELPQMLSQNSLTLNEHSVASMWCQNNQVWCLCIVCVVNGFFLYCDWLVRERLWGLLGSSCVLIWWGLQLGNLGDVQRSLCQVVGSLD